MKWRLQSIFAFIECVSVCVCVPLYLFLSCARCITANEHSWIYLSILNHTKEMILLVKRICSVNQTYASVSMMETRKLLLLKCFGWCETNSPVIMCVYSNSRQSRFVSLCTLYIKFSIFHIIYNSMELKMIGNDSLLSAQLNCSKGTQLKLLYDMYVFFFFFYVFAQWKTPPLYCAFRESFVLY